LSRAGEPDILVVNNEGGTVSVLRGNGDGTFQPATDYAVGTSPVAVAVADVGRAGKPAVVVVNFGDDTVSLLLGKPPPRGHQAPTSSAAYRRPFVW